MHCPNISPSAFPHTHATKVQSHSPMLLYPGNCASEGIIAQIFKRKQSYLDVVVHACSPSTQEVKVWDLYEFEATLGSPVSSRPTWATVGYLKDTIQYNKSRIQSCSNSKLCVFGGELHR